MSAIATLVTALRDPASATALNGAQWSAVISVARAEVLLGTLAHRLRDVAVPPGVRAVLDDALSAADQAQVAALWEVEMARRALAPIGVTPVLLKGSAYVVAGLSPAPGRQIGDLDILVPRARLDAVEAALIAAGWEWVKDDPYDQAYYRTHMHELPPLIHGVRDRMIDVHHTIVPLTARVTPDAAAMLADAVAVSGGCAVPGGVSILCPADKVCHAAAHLFADGDMAGGLRNLWDIHSLLSDYAARESAFWSQLRARANHHGLFPALARAARLAHDLYGTPVAPDWPQTSRRDAWYRRRLLARDDWGRESAGGIRLVFYIRSHWLRMPPMMLARHLWVKWRRG